MLQGPTVKLHWDAHIMIFASYTQAAFPLEGHSS